MTSIGTRICVCGGCQEAFSAPSSFDRHLKGVGTDNVQCATPEQMRQLGMDQYPNGMWYVADRSKGKKKEVLA